MDDLTNDLINAIVPYGEAIDLEIVRAKFQVILAGYNISKQSHEIALTDDKPVTVQDVLAVKTNARRRIEDYREQ